MGETQRGFLVSTLLLAVCATVPPAAFGDLDPSFGANGFVSLHLDGSGSIASAVAQQPDAKLVLAGGGNDFLIVRLLENGATDPSFGSGGVSRVDFFGYPDRAQALVIQDDGKIVVAGYAGRLDATEIGAARLNSDGSLDASFGEGGKTAPDIDGNVLIVSNMIQQPDGKLVIAGGVWQTGTGTSLLLVRLDSDGALDTSFGDGGRLIFGLPGDVESWINSVALQPDGRLVVAGSARAENGFDIVVARVMPNGELDASFGEGGTRSYDVGGGDELGLSVIVQPDARIVLSGYTVPQGESESQPLLLRLESDGELDAGFGAAGTAVVDLGGSSTLNALLLQADGRLVAAGTLSTATAGPDMIAVRFDAGGSVDPSFGWQGLEIVDYGHGAEAHVSEGNGLARQSDGKYVLVGANSLGAFSAVRFEDAAVFPGLIGLTRTVETVDESASAVTYTVRRTGGSRGAVSVDYATVADSAKAGKDFQDTTGTLSWATGDRSDRTISIGIIDDVDVESYESFGLQLSGAKGGARLAARRSVTYISSRDGPGTVGFLNFFFPYEVIESDATIRIPVSRYGGSEGAVSVSYSTTSGTARSGSDFKASSGTLQWADGELGTKTIGIRILQDSIAEGREGFAVCLRNPTGGVAIAFYAPVKTVIINDDDGGIDGGLGVSSCTVSGSGSGSGSGAGSGGDGGGGGSGGGGGGSTEWTLAWLLALLMRRRANQSVNRGSVRSSGRGRPGPRGR